MKLWRFSFWMLLFITSTVIIPSSLATDLHNKFIPVLCYHRVSPKISSIYDLTPEMLEEHLQFFKENGYHPITALQYVNSQTHPEILPDNPVVLTFDDGNKDHYQYVFPLLQQYGYQATFFIYPAAVSEKSAYSITWDELLEMKQAGMDIESHTFTHPFLTRTETRPDDPHYLKWLDHELMDSKNLLERKLHTKIALLAYPYGWYNCVVETKAVEAGYQGIFNVNWGTNLLDENPLRLKRRPVSNNFSLFEMERYLTSKPLSLEIISPDDASIINEKPMIQFKLRNPHLPRVDIVVDKYKGDLTPNNQGIFTFTKFKTLYSGYYMIIVSGYDDNGQLYINTWGFDYQKPTVDTDKLPNE
jgi:peptidoglycan/xylan/chitin deacetylase (PgdA/CDA1 family)